MEILFGLCGLLLLLIFYLVQKIIDLNDRIKRMTKSFNNLTNDSNYNDYQKSLMVEMRDLRIKQQQLTIRKLQNEKNSHNRPQV